MRAYDENVDRNLTVRRINITANRVIPETEIETEKAPEQLSFFEDFEEKEKRRAEEEAALEKEHRMQETIVGLKKKYGKSFGESLTNHKIFILPLNHICCQ